MNRSALLLAILAAMALVVVSFLFLVKPKMDEVAELQVEADDVRDQQTQIRSEISALEGVRSTSPSIEAELAAVSSLIPSEPALPAALRQLQVAADDSGVTLISVAPGAPADAGVEDAPRLAAITMGLSIEGGYFQVVDFLRRLEDPEITARGILVQDVTASPAEYPTLAVSLSTTIFSLLDEPAGAQPEPEPTETATEGQDTDDADVEVDVDVTEEDAA